MFDYDLKVLTDHLHHLADRQRAAGTRIRMGEEKVSGMSTSVLMTHGVACWATKSAMAAAEAARHAAATNTCKASADLADRLNWAAENYNDADWLSGAHIGRCGL